MSQPAPAPEAAQVAEQVAEERLNSSLNAKVIALAHHNRVYKIAVGVFFWLVILVYGPLTYLVYKIVRALCNNHIESLKELIGAFAQKDLGMVLVVLCVIPIYLLSGLLKYNRIDTPQDTDEGDNIFSPFFPGN